MNTEFIPAARLPSVLSPSVFLPQALGKEANIINRREIEPLLDKARKVLEFYREAMNCSAVVLDRNGCCVSVQEYKNQMRFCGFCSHFRQASPVPAETQRGNNCPCKVLHSGARPESRRIDETYVFTCPAGFVYWTSPIFRNGRYAGTLLAGQVLSGGPEAAAEKLKAFCRDRTDTGKISRMFKETPVKSHTEIQAMARLLGICAGEISGNGDNPGGTIIRMVREKGSVKNSREPNAAAIKEDHPARKEAAPEHLLEQERTLLAAFRRGDTAAGRRILKELIDNLQVSIPGDFEIIRFRAIELVVLLSRAAVSGAGDSEVLVETNNQYFRRIQESKTREELINNLNIIAERMAGKIFSFQGIRHASVLLKAERYIWDNYTRKISLKEIAKASGLSGPYFSTVFKEEMGINLSSYLNNLRVEKAVTLLTETGKSLNEIAGLCGFEDQSWFSKIFKNCTGMSPGKYRENGGSPEFRPGRNHAAERASFPTQAGRDIDLNEQRKLSS
ncbi:MAG: PocR ligand-binding domain-containing protein [Treponema sp.]|nr:PocR ligand-binding domain-containing protein [Treponema sp.]